MKNFSQYFIILFSVLFLSCKKDIGKVNTGNYPDDVNAIITKNCSVAGCHNGASAEAAAGLNLETWSSLFQGAKSGLPVIPFNSRFSSLCYFINVYPELGPISQPTMPLNKSPLTSEQVQTIKKWIDAGAPNRDGEIKWADDPQRKKLYAVNQGCDVVTVFDSQSQLPIRYIQVGSEKSTPHQLRVSPDGKYWYLIFLNRNVMKKYRCSDDVFVADIPLTPLAAKTGPEDALDWNTFVITKDGKRAYCVSLSTNGAIAAVDLEKEKLIAMKPGGYFPHGISLNEMEDKMYVASQQSNYITEIDTAFQNYQQYSLDGSSAGKTVLEPHDVLLMPGNKLLITCQNTNEVRIFDLFSKTTSKVVSTAVFPQEVVFSKKFNMYYVTCMGDNTKNNPGALTKINASTFESQNLLCGAQPHGLAIDQNKDLLYVLSRNISTSGPIPHHTSLCAGKNGFVNFIDLNTFTITNKRYELSADPYFIYARP